MSVVDWFPTHSPGSRTYTLPLLTLLLIKNGNEGNRAQSIQQKFEDYLDGEATAELRGVEGERQSEREGGQARRTFCQTEPQRESR